MKCYFAFLGECEAILDMEMDHLHKVAVLLTEGRIYCKGVEINTAIL
jgi:hypothetical protein